MSTDVKTTMWTKMGKNIGDREVRRMSVMFSVRESRCGRDFLFRLGRF